MIKSSHLYEHLVSFLLVKIVIFPIELFNGKSIGDKSSITKSSQYYPIQSYYYYGNLFHTFISCQLVRGNLWNSTMSLSTVSISHVIDKEDQGNVALLWHRYSKRIITHIMGSIQFSSHLLPLVQNLAKYDPIPVSYHHPTLPCHSHIWVRYMAQTTPYHFHTFALVRVFYTI